MQQLSSIRRIALNTGTGGSVLLHRSLLGLVWVGAAASSPVMAHDRASQSNTIVCETSPTPGQRPASMECALIGHKLFESLPSRPTAYFETFPTVESARRAETPTSVVAQAAGKVWLVGLRPKGTHPRNGALVAEIGPLPVPPARSYTLVVGEVSSRPGTHSRVHTHPGPEAWYLISGEQCLEMPDLMVRTHAGEAVFAYPNTPMKLAVRGTADREALFIVVYDAKRPWSTPSSWQPRGRCGR